MKKFYFDIDKLIRGVFYKCQILLPVRMKHRYDAPSSPLHSQNPCLRTHASAYAAAFCSLRGQVARTISVFAAIISRQNRYYPATVQVEKIIAQQKKLGAEVSEDLTDYDYGWDESGRLTRIYWNYDNLSGAISFAGLDALTYLDCSENQLTELDVSKNTALTALSCSDNQLTELDVTNCELEEYDCDPQVNVIGYKY